MKTANVEELVKSLGKVEATYVGLLDRKVILRLIKDYVKHDRFNVLKPRAVKSDKYIRYWAAITYYDTKLSEALSASPNKWYKMICEEIKDYVKKKSLSNAEIARYYKENY